ncbi:MAG TPA: undecaprenyl-diphosphate phosphatase [Bacteriovoracaceae bacterium]|nr:undecaprenyl-diphosphate phosphatase [Bacteriovoracaceae bacterium]
MNNLEAIIYGIIQGLSEFLPISSSGHLALLPHLMEIQDPGVKFDLMMHLGTALAIIVYFKDQVKNLLSHIHPKIFLLKEESEELSFFKNFTVATITSVVFILLLLPISKLAREPWIIILNLTFFGGLLWAADFFNKKRVLSFNPMEQGLNFKYACLIGAAQALAIFPGVSRSGITITMALFLGMRRKDAGSFSFLMSLPIILAGILKEVPDLVSGGDTTAAGPLIIGIATSFIIGWLTIHFFMKLIARIPLGVFAIYRWGIAAIIYLTIIL